MSDSGGGQVVSLLAFYFDNSSLNTVEVCKIVFEKNKKNKQACKAQKNIK